MGSNVNTMSWRRVSPGRYELRCGSWGWMEVFRIKPSTGTSRNVNGREFVVHRLRWQVRTESGAFVGSGCDTLAEAKRAAEEWLVPPGRG